MLSNEIIKNSKLSKFILLYIVEFLIFGLVFFSNGYNWYWFKNNLFKTHKILKL